MRGALIRTSIIIITECHAVVDTSHITASYELL